MRFANDGEKPHMVFEHSVHAKDENIYFAFTYPYSYSQLQTELEALDRQYVDANNDSNLINFVKADSSNINSNKHGRNRDDVDKIYYHRELLTNSLDGRRIDLLTITSLLTPNSINKATDEKLQIEREPLLPSLFPNQTSKRSSNRPPIFAGKEVVFVSARVHPGEVPAQHTFKGILDILMDPTDIRAKELRNRYVFKLIPMLNPDGVYRGHFRMDQLGQNLNRYYLNPCSAQQPSIFGSKSLLDYYNAAGTLSFYLDFHAHTSRRGCFIYGNVLDSAEAQIQNQLFCRLMTLNTPHFDYEACLFSKEHMNRIDGCDAAKGLTAEGSGRVSTYLNYGLIHSYTIECNYNTSKTSNEIPPLEGHTEGQIPEIPASPFSTSSEKYTPTVYAGVGRACMLSILDLRGHNPCSRIPKSKMKTFDRIRNSVVMEVRTRKEFVSKSSVPTRRVDYNRRGNNLNINSVKDIDALWRRTVHETPSTEDSNSNKRSIAAASPRAGSNLSTRSGSGSNIDRDGSNNEKSRNSNSSGDDCTKQSPNESLDDNAKNTTATKIDRSNSNGIAATSSTNNNDLLRKGFDYHQRRISRYRVQKTNSADNTYSRIPAPATFNKYQIVPNIPQPIQEGAKGSEYLQKKVHDGSKAKYQNFFEMLQNSKAGNSKSGSTNTKRILDPRKESGPIASGTKLLPTQQKVDTANANPTFFETNSDSNNSNINDYVSVPEQLSLRVLKSDQMEPSSLVPVQKILPTSSVQQKKNTNAETGYPHGNLIVKNYIPEPPPQGNTKDNKNGKSSVNKATIRDRKILGKKLRAAGVAILLNNEKQ